MYITTTHVTVKHNTSAMSIRQSGGTLPVSAPVASTGSRLKFVLGAGHAKKAVNPCKPDIASFIAGVAKMTLTTAAHAHADMQQQAIADAEQAAANNWNPEAYGVTPEVFRGQLINQIQPRINNQYAVKEGEVAQMRVNKGYGSSINDGANAANDMEFATLLAAATYFRILKLRLSTIIAALAPPPLAQQKSERWRMRGGQRERIEDTDAHVGMKLAVDKMLAAY